MSRREFAGWAGRVDDHFRRHAGAVRRVENSPHGVADDVDVVLAQPHAAFLHDEIAPRLATGFQPDAVQITNDLYFSRVHPDDLPHAMADIQRHFRGETAIYVNEHRMRCKEGTYKWILDRGKVVARGDNGSPLRVVGTHSDVTVRRAMEEQLRAERIIG